MIDVRAWLLAAVLAVAGAEAFAATPNAADAQPTAESTTLTGTLMVSVADDFVHRTAQLLYSVEVAPGRHVDVRFDTPPRRLRSGMQVRLHGRHEGRAFRVRDEAAVAVLDRPPSAQALPAPGKRRVLLVLTDIATGDGQVHALSHTCDAVDDDTAALMFAGPGETVDGAYLESSFGLEGIGGASYPGTALDVVRVQIAEAGFPLAGLCNPTPWADAADAAATTAGVALGNYQHRVYVLPNNLGCPWGGLGQLGCGDNCRAWEATYSYYPCGTRGAHAHELGHNRGLMHASTDLDNDGTIDAEYGDTSDFMGSNFDELQHNNAPHKLEMGWIDAADVVDATAGGTYTLSALELADAPFAQVLKLLPESGAPLYVSYRAPLGYDATMPDGGNTLSRTSVHRWASIPGQNTLFLGSVGDGEVLGDAAVGVSIRQLSHDGDSAVVEVTRVTPPVLAIAPPSHVEGTGGMSYAVFVLTLSAPAPWPVGVYLSTFDGTAVAGSDFVDADLVYRQIPAGETTLDYPVAIHADAAGEGNETFELILDGVQGASAPVSNWVATIVDDDAVLSIADATTTEGDAGTKTLTFVASLSQPAGAPVTFLAGTDDGTATAGSDYVGRPLTRLAIPAGQQSRTFKVTVNGDTAVEDSETFSVAVIVEDGAAPGDTHAVGTIANDDGPLLSIADPRVIEGASGNRTLTFVVTLSKAATVPVTFDFATIGGTASAGVDYLAANLVGESIPAGQLSKTIGITVHGDTDPEANETLVASVANVSGASVVDGSGIGTIVNDDGPTLSISDAVVVEGDTSRRLVEFIVTLSEALGVPVSFGAATSNGSAHAGSDYEARTAVNQFIPAGQRTKAFAVWVTGDTGIEANETFAAQLTAASGATILDYRGVATVLNDDGPTLSISDPVIAEGASGTKQVTFVVSLSQVAGVPVTYDIATAGGTATAGSDYLATSRVAETIAAGQLSKTFTVVVNGDAEVEGNETVLATVGGVAGATLRDGQGSGTIRNDDGPTLSIADAAITEGTSGYTVLSFTVTLSQAAAAPVAFDIATGNGTAIAGTDYIGTSLVAVSIAAGQTTKTVKINLKGDTTLEPNETFAVNITAASGASVWDDRAVGTIVNDD